jgi:hypothetical protein
MNGNSQHYRLGLGKILERWIVRILEVIFPVALGYRIIHNDWNNYCWDNNGTDIKVYRGCREILTIECKNWRLLANLRYGIDQAKTEVINRFSNTGGGIKLVIFSFLSVLYQPAIDAIKATHIHMVEIGKLVGKTDFKSKLFYQFKAKLEKVIKGLLADQNRQLSLLSYTSIPNRVIDSNNTDTITKKLHTGKEVIVRKPVIPINHPCQVGHPDHEKWLEHQYRLMSKAN